MFLLLRFKETKGRFPFMKEKVHKVEEGSQSGGSVLERDSAEKRGVAARTVSEGS